MALSALGAYSDFDSFWTLRCFLFSAKLLMAGSLGAVFWGLRLGVFLVLVID